MTRRETLTVAVGAVLSTGVLALAALTPPAPQPPVPVQAPPARARPDLREGPVSIHRSAGSPSPPFGGAIPSAGRYR